MRGSSKRTRRTIGKVVAAHRERRGLSRPALAAKLGIDRSYLWRIERGLARPSGEVEDRIVAFFGITVDELRSANTRAAA